jgi:parallel beta-helix repeat protein
LGRRKIGLVFGFWALLVFVAVFGVVLNVPVVRGSGTIYIRADGSIDPPTAPIQRDGDFFTLIGNIVSDVDGIVIQRDNIALDGAGYTVQGSGSGSGISIDGNITIKNVVIKSFDIGVSIAGAGNNRIIGNNITANSRGVSITVSSDNRIVGNNITNNDYGISFYNQSLGNNIIRNNIMNNGHGVGFFNDPPEDNIFYHNNFINNAEQVVGFNSIFQVAWSNIWDNGYPSGNYWSDYNGVDSNSDGIGDTPYIIDTINRDNFPLMNPKLVFVRPLLHHSLIRLLFQ